MTESEVTVIIVPRERFRLAPESLDSLYVNTTVPFTLIYIDAGSPKEVQHAIEARAIKYEFRLIRTEHYPSPNEARNLVLDQITTPYAVFADNDVFLNPIGCAAYWIVLKRLVQIWYHH